MSSAISLSVIILYILTLYALYLLRRKYRTCFYSFFSVVLFNNLLFINSVKNDSHFSLGCVCWSSDFKLMSRDLTLSGFFENEHLVTTKQRKCYHIWLHLYPLVWVQLTASTKSLLIHFQQVETCSSPKLTDISSCLRAN